MLFLVVTHPRREPPSVIMPRRQAHWKWIDPLLKSGVVRWVYARVGRGGVALFDVASTLELHQYLNEWAEYVPAQFDIYPLLDSHDAQAYLRAHEKKFPTAKAAGRRAKKASPAAKRPRRSA